jgi:hypothetical protein
LLTGVNDGGSFCYDHSGIMNDFLRPCNCVHPAEEDCEKCVEETSLKKTPELSDAKEPQKSVPKVVEIKKGN